MPSAYTSKLYDGESQSFAEFVLDCARAFGALITLRDSPDAEIPDEFPADTGYDDRALADARSKLDELSSMSPEAATAARDAAHAAAVERWTADNERTQALVARYEAMLEQVRSWEPPTAEHRGLRDFMENQLVESIKFDGTTMREPVLLPVDEWLAQEIGVVERAIAHHSKQRAAEIERARERTAWVKALRQSLDPTRSTP